MKKTIGAFIAALVVGVVVGAATRADAGPKLKPNTEQFVIGCDAGMNYAIQTAGSFAIAVTGETSWLCAYDAGCATSGQPYAVGSAYMLDFDKGEPLSCRGIGITGAITGTYVYRGNP